MQDAEALEILGTAYDLSATSDVALRKIARLALHAIPGAPVAVARFDGDDPLRPECVHFEHADANYRSRFFAWQRLASDAARRHARSLSPRAVNFHTGACAELSDQLAAMARQTFPLCVMANLGDGSGIYIMSGSPAVRTWQPAQLRSFHEVARYVAVAWRIRKALHAVRAAGSGADRGDAAVAGASLRRAVLARGSDPPPAGGALALWPALLTGEWSVLDRFTAAGTCHVVVYRNPAQGVTLRALPPRERTVLELALAGRAGKWIALELQLAESSVTRMRLRALRRLGAADTPDLAGLRTAAFEPLDGVVPGVALAVARIRAPALCAPALSDAEHAVVTGVLGGKRATEIARERGTSPRTVSNQLASVYRKLAVASRRELVARVTELPAPARERGA